MKKSFKNGFDDLLNNTLIDFKKKENTDKEILYTRTTLAIKNDLLEKIRISCLQKKIKLRDIINDLLQNYLDEIEK